MEIIKCICIFILGLFFGSYFSKIAFSLSKNQKVFVKSKCDICNHNLNLFDKVPVLSYVFSLGKCKYCNQKIDILYLMSEIFTGILFIVSYINFKDIYPENINVLFAMFFSSALILIILSDIRYMIIPNEILIFFSIFLIPFKLYIYYLRESNISFLDIGYEFIFILMDGLIMFIIMYLIRKIGSIIFKKDSMGGGDVKMMVFISFILGFKMGIVVLFLGSFLALPLSIIKMYKDKEYILAFGPYLSIATLIIFLSNINFETIIEFLS